MWAERPLRDVPLKSTTRKGCFPLRGGRQFMELATQIPLQISFLGLDHSDAVEERIRTKVAKLMLLCDKITACRVTVETVRKNPIAERKKGEPYQINIEVSVPGNQLMVKHPPKDPRANEDVVVALREAFSIMERQLKEYVERFR